MTFAAQPGDMAAIGGTTEPVGSTSLSSALTTRLPGLAIGAAASLGAGAIHAAAAGIHSEHVGLTRLFVLTAMLQLGAGVVALVRPNRLVAAIVCAVNVAAVTGWLVTRLVGIDFISGLETREAAQFTDTACALLGAVAVAAALAAALVGWRPSHEPRLVFAGLAVAALAVPAMFTATTHAHSGGDGTTSAGDGHGHDAVPPGATDTTVHGHDDTTPDGSSPDDHADDHPDDTTVITDDAGEQVWPRPWDPADGIDISGVPGVTAEQEARATKLIEDSLRELPKWSTTAAAEADGYRSIGDAGTGSEHFIKATIVQDDVMLDPTQPESLVYSVAKDGTKTLAGAMFIASMRPTDDPELTNWAGPLMQWHNHGNLCWEAGKVVGIVDANGKCARGNNGGGEFPMVHVWVTPHPCGVFAALEGVGAGQATVSDEERVDMCKEGHHDDGSTPSAEPKPYDPTMPIDLSGTPGVTPQQQAAAENLIAVTLVRLPQWSDYKVAEAAGFNSIGDGLTGHEHFINWKWIDDDVVLDPDFPESLVYEPQPDGSKKLVSAMYMLPTNVALADVPDIGGALMQWHIHDNLCFTSGDAPRVAGITTSGGSCPEGLQPLDPAPMIHVWITPHKCGPFAALEGVGAGQIKPGEERLCDHAHGA
jgi:hypothetical protein